MVKKKKMLTVEDLYKFCLETNFAKFSAKESGYQLAVQVPTTFEIDDTSDDNHRGMMRLKFRILHDGKNRNGSYVSHNAAVKASNTIADRPIMAAIHQLDDGSWDFKSHEMEIIENDDGEPEINYIEKQVGSFSSEKPFWEHDDELDKDYLCAYGYVAEEYTKAADIIREKGWTKNSCELVIEEMAFNAKEKQLELNSFYLSASTLLGREDDGTPIGEGMLGSRADIADFSVENNSVFSQNEKVIKLLSELNEKLDGLNIDNSSRKEETKDLMKKKFEKKATEEEIKDSPSTEVFDEADGDGDGGNDGGDGIDYYEPEEEQQDGETPGENNDPPVGGDDDPPSGDPEEVVGEPSAEDIAAAEAATGTINALTNSSTAADVAEARAEYDALSDEAKALIEPEVYAKLEAQETRIANQEAADAVTTMITALTDSSSAEDVAAARAAYEALTTDQKALVSAQTLAALEAQEDRINEEAADTVIDMIEALTDESSAEEVEAARQAYDALTEVQKAYVSAETLALLEEQEDRIDKEGSSNDDVPKKKKVNNSSNVRYSIKCNGKIKTHYATLSEKLMALSDLVNATYGETDCTYYFVDADEDKKLVYMHDPWCDKHYRQSYSVKKDVYSLKGDRCELFARYLSQDEINEFEKMKADFSLAVEKLDQYESEDSKIALLQSEDYKQIRNTEAYTELAKKETYFSMSTEDIEKKLDEILLKYAKGNELKFSATDSEKKSVGMKLFGNSSKKAAKGSGRYGKLFG